MGKVTTAVHLWLTVTKTHCWTSETCLARSDKSVAATILGNKDLEDRWVTTGNDLYKKEPEKWPKDNDSLPKTATAADTRSMGPDAFLSLMTHAHKLTLGYNST